MLIRFTDDYINWLNAGNILVGRLVSTIAEKEPFVGNSKVLDRYYAQSVVISALVDHLSNEDNSDREANETMLQCLKSILSKRPECMSQVKKQAINKGRFVPVDHGIENSFPGPFNL